MLISMIRCIRELLTPFRDTAHPVYSHLRIDKLPDKEPASDMDASPVSAGNLEFQKTGPGKDSYGAFNPRRYNRRR